jgi:hypothetical protein
MNAALRSTPLGSDRGDDILSVGHKESHDGMLNEYEEPGRDIEECAIPNSPADENDPFGDESDSEVKYRTLTWWQAGVIMIAETISLGILSLPSALAAIGIVPGMILILGLGIIATYTGYVLGQSKLKYPQVHNMADAGEVLLGPIGREVFGLGQVALLIFVMASHILTFSIMRIALFPTPWQLCTNHPSS